MSDLDSRLLKVLLLRSEVKRVLNPNIINDYEWSFQLCELKSQLKFLTNDINNLIGEISF